MRRAFLCVFLISISVHAFALCEMNGIFPISDNRKLNRNGLIILEFYASSQERIPQLNKKYPVFLQSGLKKITLDVIEVLTGDFRVTQVVFKPQCELVEGEMYELIIDKLPEQGPLDINKITRKWEPLKYEVLNSFDTHEPALTSSFSLGEGSITLFGCGPAKIVPFHFTAIDKSELFVRTTVKNKTTGKETTYILEVQEGKISVGHGMCSGGFYFNPEHLYEARFQLMDQSGNRGPVTGSISFSSPG